MKRFLASLCACAVPALLFADVQLDPLFQDHSVFCAGKPAFISGFADPGEHITVEMPAGKFAAETGKDGRFRVEFPALPVIKTPFTITVKGKNTVQ